MMGCYSTPMNRAHIYCRMIDGQNRSDIALAERAMEDSGNLFPASAFRLPSTQIMIAEREGNPVLVQPFFKSLVMGSLAFVGKPSDEYKAAAQHAMTALAFSEAHRMALVNVIMFSNTPETRAFAGRHGFTVPQHPPMMLEVR